jgi:hypothetical protein
MWCLTFRMLLLTGFWWPISAVGYCMVSSMTIFSTLLVDLFASAGASITAANNVMRCLTGAVAVSVIEYILQALNPGWTFVLLAGLCVAAYPLILVELKNGPRWRARREEKRRKREEEQR